MDLPLSRPLAMNERPEGCHPSLQRLMAPGISEIYAVFEGEQWLLDVLGGRCLDF